MKKGDIVEVIDIDTYFPEEATNWMNSPLRGENKYAHLRDMPKIKVGDRLKISQDMASIDLETPMIKLEGYVYWHTAKRFKLVE